MYNISRVKAIMVDAGEYVSVLQESQTRLSFSRDDHIAALRHSAKRLRALSPSILPPLGYD